MNQQIVGQHFNDANGNPAGGTTTGRGISITWQNGPLGRSEEGMPLVEQLRIRQAFDAQQEKVAKRNIQVEAVRRLSEAVSVLRHGL